MSSPGSWPLQVVDQADGTRSISLRGGQPLVVGGRSATMSATTNPDGSQTLQVAFASEVVHPAAEPGWAASSAAWKITRPRH